jgi:hypothetical protein
MKATDDGFDVSENLYREIGFQHTTGLFEIFPIISEDKIQE